MSFSFTAIGARDEVVSQLGNVQVPGGADHFNEFGTELRDLLVKHFSAEDTGSYDYKYVVKASGHSGGTSPLSVQLSVNPYWIQEAAAS